MRLLNKWLLETVWSFFFCIKVVAKSLSVHRSPGGRQPFSKQLPVQFEHTATTLRQIGKGFQITAIQFLNREADCNHVAISLRQSALVRCASL